MKIDQRYSLWMNLRFTNFKTVEYTQSLMNYKEMAEIELTQPEALEHVKIYALDEEAKEEVKEEVKEEAKEEVKEEVKTPEIQEEPQSDLFGGLFAEQPEFEEAKVYVEEIKENREPLINPMDREKEKF